MRAIEFPDTIAHWRPLTRPRASELEDTRKQLHWAAQLVSALGTTLLEPRADASHTNLEWSQTHAGLLGHPASRSDSDGNPLELRALLRFPEPTLVVLAGSGEHERTLASWPLLGRRFAELFTELEATLRAALADPSVVLRRPDHDLPEHRVDPQGAGEAFGGWKDHALVELTRWFENGDRALRELAAQDPRASPVRCWPHHFDIATLLVIDRADPGDPHSEVTRSLGVGMTPGDGSYADAYWYVTPWPYPAEPTLAALEGGGIWHRDGWVGAVLTSTALRQPQAERFTAFMRSALAVCEALVG